MHAKRFAPILELIRLYDDFENITFQGTSPCSNDNVLAGFVNDFFIGNSYLHTARKHHDGEAYG